MERYPLDCLRRDPIMPVLKQDTVFNLTGVQDNLLAAMQHPVTDFTFKNGTSAPAGTFNNTFGCVTLSNSGTCANPVTQTIQMYYGTGDSLSQTVMEDIAAAVNNVSSTYNMGLTVDVVPLPSGQLTSLYEAGELQCFTTAWTFDYPWVTDFLVGLYTSRRSIQCLRLEL